MTRPVPARLLHARVRTLADDPDAGAALRRDLTESGAPEDLVEWAIGRLPHVAAWLDAAADHLGERPTRRPE